MFWQKKQKFDLPFVIFGLIALGVIVSVAILLLLVADKAKDGVLRTAENIKSAGEVIENSSPAAVKEKYKNDLSALRQHVAGAVDWEQAKAAFETQFFSMRVPAELLNDHLQAFWDISKTEENGPAVSKQTEALLILDVLIKKAETL